MSIKNMTFSSGWLGTRKTKSIVTINNVQCFWLLFGSTTRACQLIHINRHQRTPWMLSEFQGNIQLFPLFRLDNLNFSGVYPSLDMSGVYNEGEITTTTYRTQDVHQSKRKETTFSFAKVEDDQDQEPFSRCKSSETSKHCNLWCDQTRTVRTRRRATIRDRLWLCW